MFKIALPILLLLGSCPTVHGQGKDSVYVLSANDSMFYFDPDMPDKLLSYKKLYLEKDLDVQLRPLQEIIDVAIRNSPQLRSQDEAIKASGYQVEMARRQWQQNLVGNINYFEGTNSQMSILPYTDSRTAVFGTGLRYGISLNIPLSEFSLRKSRIKHYEHLAAANAYEKEELEKLVAAQVISAYSRLISAQRMLKIQARGKDQANLHFTNAEIEFKSGDITISEFARVSEVARQAEVDFELARKDFFDAYYQFEALVGEKIENLTVRK